MIIEGIIGLTLCVIVIYVIRFKVRNRRMETAAAKMSGPPALPFLGNALELLGSTDDIMKSFDKLLRKHPSPMPFLFGPMVIFVIHDPEDLEVVLNSKAALEKDIVYRFTEPHLGHGLLTGPVPVWRRHRRIITPTFNSKILVSYFHAYNKQAQILVEKLEPKCAEGQEFDVFNFVALCVLDIVCETMMGVKMGAQDNKNMDYIKAVSNFTSTYTTRALTFWMHPDWIFKLTRCYRIQAEAVHILNSKVAKVVKEKREEYRLRNLDELENKEEKDGVRRHKGFLDHLLDLTENENKLTNKELQDEVCSLMLAGYDTTAVVNSTVLLLLAIHQDEQEKIYKELRNIFGDSDRDVTMEDTKLMTRMEMVINEAMRLYAMLPLMLRRLTEDLQLKNFTLPKGSRLALYTQTLYRNSEIYPEPDKFDPERFLPENVKKRHKYSFIPFSAGPRNCVGWQFGTITTKVLLATVIRKYRLHTDTKMQNFKVNVEIVQKIENGYPIRLELRKT